MRWSIAANCPSAGAGWLFAGVLDILIAAMIITGLPGSAEWAIGLLVGINLLFGGASLIGMALAARKG